MHMNWSTVISKHPTSITAVCATQTAALIVGHCVPSSRFHNRVLPKLHLLVLRRMGHKHCAAVKLTDLQELHVP